MIQVQSLGYIFIESADPKRWLNYGTEVLGMMKAVNMPDDGNAYLQMDARPFRFAIQKGKTEGYKLCGWELRDAETFEAAKTLLKKAKCEFEQGSPAEVELRQVHDFIRAQDPSGNVFELYHGGKLDYTPFDSPLGVSGFVTGEDGRMGLGHVVLCAEKLEATREFYRSLFGFDDSDYMDVPGPNGVDGLYFMHCNNPRHHSLALYAAPRAMFPGGCVHAMVEVNTIDEVGLCHQRVVDRGIHIFSTLGRHTNDHMFSFYMMSPSGFALEYGCQGRQIDWSTFTPTRTSGTGSLWGHTFNLPESPEPG